MERLVATRTTLRSIITRTANRIEEMLASGDVASTAVEEKLEILSQKAASLNDTQQKINDLVEVSSLPEEIEGHLVYEERLAQIRTRARQVLHHPPSSGSGTQGTAPQRPAGPHTPSRTVALPKLQIETFDGTWTAWSTFWDHYSSTIHTRPDLPKVEKFKYLRSYLTGAAKRAIDFISLSDANYDRAVAALTERFGRPDLIVQEHVSTLLAVTAVRSSSDVHLLRSLYDHVVFCIRSLENLGVPPVEYAVVLHSVLLRALPDDLSILYRQRIKEGSATSHSTTASDTDSVSAVTASNVEKMLAFLRVQVESREELAHTSSAKPGSNPVPKAPHTSSASALAASIRSSQHTPCLFCASAAHWVDSCPSALSFEEKKARLQRDDRCFKCAKKYHVARKCRSCRSLRCARCNGRHLTALCNPSWGPQLSSGPGSPSESPRTLSTAPLTDPPQPPRGPVPRTSSTSSPPSQLEAEILRLTTRLMMRERDLKQAKQQIKQESTRSSQNVASWRTKVKQKEEQLKALLQEKDEEMKIIVSQLLLLEGQLRKEQQRIEKILEEKDAIIKFQRHELAKLKKERMRSQRHLDRLAREELVDGLNSLPAECMRRAVATVSVETQTEDVVETQTKSLTALQQLCSDLIRSRAVQDLTDLPDSHAKKEKTIAQMSKTEADDTKGKKLERVGCMDEFLEEKDMLRIKELHCYLLMRYDPPPWSPWWGGWCERMIRTIKDTSRKTLKNACLRFEELNTVLHEVEAVVNSRPLIYVGTDPQEAPPVTPADFLIGKRITALPCTPPTNCESSPASLRRRLKRREKYTRDVCRRWKRDYILQLRSAHHRGGQRHSHPPLQEGNVVLLEDSSPAQFWKMGIIVQSYQGADGATRLHTVRLADGSEKLIPAQRLCLLEAGQPAAGGGC